MRELIFLSFASTAAWCFVSCPNHVDIIVVMDVKSIDTGDVFTKLEGMLRWLLFFFFGIVGVIGWTREDCSSRENEMKEEGEGNRKKKQ